MGLDSLLNTEYGVNIYKFDLLTEAFARAWFTQIQIRVGHQPLSQSQVWDILENMVPRPELEIQRRLKRICDLAYQAAMSSGIEATLALGDEPDARFMHGALMGEFRYRRDHDDQPHLNWKVSATLRAAFSIRTVENL